MMEKELEISRAGAGSSVDVVSGLNAEVWMRSAKPAGILVAQLSAELPRK